MSTYLLKSKNEIPEWTDTNGGDFLLGAPRGAYTTARTFKRHAIFEVL